jgi:hypothetical protein
MRKNTYSLMDAPRDTLRSVSRIYRTEVLGRDKFGSTEGLPRFVVIVEIPDGVASILKTSLEAKAYEVADDATREQRFNDPNVAFRGWSSSVVTDVNPADYGRTQFYGAPDGSRAWILQGP